MYWLVCFVKLCWLLPFHDLTMTFKFSFHRRFISLALLISHFQNKPNSLLLFLACFYFPRHLMDITSPLPVLWFSALILSPTPGPTYCREVADIKDEVHHRPLAKPESSNKMSQGFCFHQQCYLEYCHSLFATTNSNSLSNPISFTTAILIISFQIMS